MRPLLALIPGLALLLLGGAPALAGNPSREAVVQLAHGLQLNRAALRDALGQPPAPGSKAASNDFAILLWLQNFRTPEMEANTWLFLDRNPVLFSRALGVDMVKQTPLIHAGVMAFVKPLDAVMGEFKQQFGRPRPYLQDSRIRPCLPREESASFPSGHSTWYRASAELLADLIPERRERLLAVGDHGGAARTVCGVHFPSDVEAGQRLGAAGARLLMATPQWRAFRNDPGVQAELQKLRQVPAESLIMLTR
jgi:acid phosphatase (class A)